MTSETNGAGPLSPAPPASLPTRRGDRPKAEERGSGLITSIVGVVLVLITVFVAVEALVVMQRRTVITGLADDLARRLARDSMLDARAEATAITASLGKGVTVVSAMDGDDVVVTITASGPGLVPLGILGAFEHIERTTRARIERFQPGGSS